MYYSFTGKIICVSDDSIAVDVNGIAFELFVARPLEWHVGEESIVYSYEVYNENDHYLVGFSTKMEKDAFKSLIQVKGIGPKTAINALSATTPDE
ncbi:MAG TPA: Holliday junction branch migration protein RuvA, partial [Firmicutes bacterium]|nr:Holliday junction branch migration protein RuvA [Bacillota bacterium]